MTTTPLDTAATRGLPPGTFGRELQIDLAGCDRDMVRDPDALRDWARHLVDEIGMTAYGEPIVQRFGEDELAGVTVIQLITTSSIMVHANDDGTAFVNVFSCRDFSTQAAIAFTVRAFTATKYVVHDQLRQAPR